MINFKHTVDCLQTPIVCKQRTVCFYSIDRMSFLNHSREYRHTPKEALTITQGSVS